MVPPDKSIVHMHARPGVSRPYQGWYHTMHLLSHAEASVAPIRSAVQPQQAYGCVIVHGDSRRLENKTGRPDMKRFSLRRKADSCTSIGRETVDGEAVVVQTKIF